MKKIIRIILLFCFIMCICNVPSYANYEKANVYIDGELLVTDQPGIILNNRTLVPLRAICEALGCSVLWDEKNNEAEVSNDAVNVRIKINSYYMIKSYKAFHNDLKEGYVDDSYVDYYEEIELDVPPMIINNRTLIPVRAISEAIYATVSWDEENQNVEITSKYDKISGFSENLAIIQKGNKLGYIDIKGSVVIPFEYDLATDFRKGCAIVTKNGKMGVIRGDGSVIIPFEYDHMYHFYTFSKQGYLNLEQGLAGACKNGKWGIVDVYGKVIVPFIYDYVLGFSENLALVKKDGKCGWVNREGDIAIPLEYDEGGHFHNNRAIVRKDSKYGLINSDGNIVIPLEYDAIHSDSNIVEGQFCMAKDGNFGWLDSEGNILVPFEYDAVAKMSPLFSIVCKDGKYGVVNMKDENIEVPIIYDGVKSFTDNMIVFQKDSKWGIVNTENKVVVPFIYDDFEGWTYGFAAAKKGDKWGVVNTKNGEITIPIIYEKLKCVAEGVIAIEKGGKWGAFSTEGNIIIPFVCDEIQLYKVSGKSGGILKTEQHGKTFYYDGDGNLLYQ